MTGDRDDRVQHETYGWVDRPCIRLCDAVNRMPGLRTTYSCCGHAEQSFYIFVSAEEVAQYAPLVHVLKKARNWREMLFWEVSLLSRTGEDLAFILKSASVGQIAYDEADAISGVIESYLAPIGSLPDFDEKWNLGKY